MTDTDFDEVKNLLLGAVPERREEVLELLERYQVGFRSGADTTGFKLENSYGQVIYNDRTMMQIYLLSFLAWRALRAYSGIIILNLAANKPFDCGSTANLPGQADADGAVDRLAGTLLALRECWGVADVPWPEDIPSPRTDRHEDDEDQAAQDVGLMAAAYVILHEIHHVVLPPEEAPGRMAEEFLCDEFARWFMLDKIDQYARDNNVDARKVLNKRAMGIALANGIYAEITPPALWSGSSHPPLIDRFKANYSGWPADPNAPPWVYMASICLARLRREGRALAPIPFATARKLCESLTEKLC